MNIFDDIAPHGPEEQIALLARSGAVRIERIVSHSHVSAPGFWFDQPEDEWVYVAKGSGTLAFEDGRALVLAAGDHVFIPAGCRHRVTHTQAETVWIAVFMPSCRPEAN